MPLISIEKLSTNTHNFGPIYFPCTTIESSSVVGRRGMTRSTRGTSLTKKSIFVYFNGNSEYVHTHTHTLTHSHSRSRCAYIYVLMYIHICIHTHVRVSIDIYIYVCTYIYPGVCMLQNFN